VWINCLPYIQEVFAKVQSILSVLSVVSCLPVGILLILFSFLLLNFPKVAHLQQNSEDIEDIYHLLIEDLFLGLKVDEHSV
jgi:hypothetical protein